MMIKFVHGLQGNGAMYGTIGFENKNTAHTYSQVQPRPSPEKYPEKYSFARTVDEVCAQRHLDTRVKTEVKDKDRVRNKSTHKDDVNTAKDTGQQSEKVNNDSRDTKSVKNNKAEDENTVKVSAKRNNDDEIFDDENALSHVQLQKAHVSQIKHGKNGERTSAHISSRVQKVEDTEVEEEENLDMGEKQSDDTLRAAEREHRDFSSISRQEARERTDGEFEKSWDNTHRDIRDKAMTKMHARTEINEKREDHTSRSADDEFMRDEDTQKSSKDQVRLKSDDEKHAHAKPSSEMSMHDDGKEKPQSLGVASHMSLNTIHDKTHSLRKATSSMLEKKGLRYLEQHGNQRLVHNVKLLFRENSTGDIRLQLNPKELGDVKLIVRIDDNNLVHARAVVLSEDAKDVMQKNLGNLAKQFDSEGYGIGSFSVSVNTEHSDTNDGTQQFSNRRSQRDENVYAAEVEQNMRSYVRVWQSVDFVA